MSSNLESPAVLNDNDLVVRVRALARRERRVTAQLVAALAEFDRRRLYLAQGCSVAVRVLHGRAALLERAAYTRMEVARTALRFPVVLQRLEEGSVTLTTIRRLGPVLTDANHGEVLAAAAHKKKADVDCSWPHCARGQTPSRSCGSCRRRARPARRFIQRHPQPRRPFATPGPSTVMPTEPPAVCDLRRRKSQRRNSRRSHPSSVRSPPSATESSSPRRARCTTSSASRRRCCATDPHWRPRCDLRAWLGSSPGRSGANEVRRHIEAPTTEAVGPRSRHIPAAVKREVWRRDDGRFAFVGTEGRCRERGFVEFHHVVPFADGGAATPGNIELRCRAHNAYEAERPLVRLSRGKSHRPTTRSSRSEEVMWH